VWVELANVWARVGRASPEEREWLDGFLSYPTKFFRPGAPMKFGRASLFNDGNGTFPAGLLALVQRGAPEAGFAIELDDKREPAILPDPSADLAWLRPYQLDAVRAGLREQRGVFQHATAAGKGEVIAAFPIAVPGARWLTLTHRKDILMQLADTYEQRSGESVGRVGDGMFHVQRHTVAMVPTLASGLARKDARVIALVRSAEGIQADEAHVFGARTAMLVCRAATRARYRLGYSGTPFARGDGRGIAVVGVLGPTIHKMTADDLLALGMVAKPEITMVPIIHGIIDRGAWAEQYTDAVVQGSVRNAAIVAAVKAAAKPCLVFVKALEHGRVLERALNADGVQTEFVWGAHETTERRAAIRRLEHGDIDVLVANVIFQEGVNIPALRSLVIAAGGKSTIACVQDVGRGMRRHDKSGAEVKAAFAVYDFDDRGGPPWLANHARARRSAYRKQGYSVVVG
jgi:superfamily II DNA or RNA helicase